MLVTVVSLLTDLMFIWNSSVFESHPSNMLQKVKLSSILDNTHNSRKLRKRSALPASVSWNERGLVTPVKDQKSCGCCWVYSSVAAMETNYHLATGDKVSNGD